VQRHGKSGYFCPYSLHPNYLELSGNYLEYIFLCTTFAQAPLSFYLQRNRNPTQTKRTNAMTLIVTLAAITAAFLGFCYFIARAIAGIITARNEAREEKQRKAEYWNSRSRSSWRAF